ncbi:MAG: putative hydrolase [Actinomycetota bacterium]|nr:putative hydrolase [Actinomycetota bacterium]
MPDALLRNDEIGTLLLAASLEEDGHRRRALDRAAKFAWIWPEEAAGLVRSGRALTELQNVGPWVAAKIEAWFESRPPVPEPDETRRGFLTYAQIRAALDEDPSWEAAPHGDLQVHSTDSDGSTPLTSMAAAAADLGRSFMASTDHSTSLRIANGMSADELREQGRRIDATNEGFAADGSTFRVLRSIEMDVFEDGSCDMQPQEVEALDLVLGAFHTKLRRKEDVTDRYLRALNNPLVHVLAHPTTRMFGRRAGLIADWPRVFAEAARLGKAVELDATPRRQDLPLELAEVALAEGVAWFSMGSDAHSPDELRHLPIAMGTAILAGIPKKRFLNYLPPSEVTVWANNVSAGQERG